MTDAIQSQDLSDAKSPSESNEFLALTLDDLLERYLNVLDKYQKLRHTLDKTFSDGYISLVQANFSNPNRIRYGQDYYDGRMQALVHFALASVSPGFRAVDAAAANPSTTPTTEKQDPLQPLNHVVLHDSDITPLDPKDKRKTLRDPLHWFGILVPPALRISQHYFKIATTEIIPALAILTTDLREMEIQVRRARKKLKKVN